MERTFRNQIVCQQPLALYARPQFLLWGNSKMYSVSVTLKNDPKIEWPSDNKVMAFNPWLRQTKLAEFEEGYMFRGVGYDSVRPEKGLKIFGANTCKHNEKILQEHRSVVIYIFKINEWKCKCFDGLTHQPVFYGGSISFDGNSYWILPNQETNKYFIESFDLSKEIYREDYCVLPWDMNTCSVPRLSTFRKDRFSVLTKFFKTNNIEILVTKNKVNIDDGENVEWMKFMSLSVPISSSSNYYSSPSYFIDDVHNNSVVMCCLDENEKLCIYIVRGNEVKKIHIGFNARNFSYVPSLVPVP